MITVASDDGAVMQVVNMSSFFNREIFMHSFGDMRFSKPIALKRMMYTVLFILLWTVPLVFTFGVVFELWFAAIALVPPFVLGALANKPIWGGRVLPEFLKVTAVYLGEPKGWTDHRNDNSLGEGVYDGGMNVWVSRRRELRMLAAMKEARKQGTPIDNYVVADD